MTFGNLFSTHVQYIQWYSYTGVLGGSLWIIVINYLLFLSIWKTSNRKYLCGISAFIIFILPVLFSKYQYNKKHTDFKNNTRVYIVQPCANTIKNKINEFSLIDSVFANITKFDTTGQPSTILLSETFLKEVTWRNKVEDNRSIQRISWYLKRYPDTKCITGLLLNEANSSDEGRRTNEYLNYSYDVYDAAICFGNTVKPQYHFKSNLIPIEEFLPQYLRTFNFYSDNFSAGNDFNAFKINDSLSIATGICFEMLFSNSIAKICSTNEVALIGMIANEQMLTGETEKKTYTNISKLRAIENGVYLAKSSNTGFTGLISPKGDIIFTLAQNKFGVSQLNIPIIKEKTFYTRYFNKINEFIILQFLIFIAVILTGRIYYLFRPITSLTTFEK